MSEGLDNEEIRYVRQELVSLIPIDQSNMEEEQPIRDRKGIT